MEEMARKETGKVLVCAVLVVCLFEFAMACGGKGSWASSDPVAPAVAAKTRAVQVLSNQRLRFEANQGQADAQVSFLARGQGYSLLLTPGESVFALSRKSTNAGMPLEHETAVVRMAWKGGDPRVQVTGLEPLEGKTNYLIGNDPSAWHRDVASFAKVRYQNLYPGVDLVFYGNPQQLEYDFVVAPGADLGAIRLAFKGEGRLSVDERGNLVIEAGQGKFVQKAPIIYQEFDGTRRQIAGSYIMKGENEVGFKVAAYDAQKALFIDPVLAFASFLGGDKDDFSTGIAVDGSGNMYVAGYIKSINFLGGASGRSGTDFDVLVTKISAAGSLVYSTYVGGGGDDDAYGIAVDSAGTAYVTGVSGCSPNSLFPNVGGVVLPIPCAVDDAFLFRLNAEGSALLYSTLLVGGSSDIGFAVAADNNGNAYVVGMSVSEDSFPLWPTHNSSGLIGPGGSYDAFIVKIDTNLSGAASLKYATRFGGQGWDYAYGVTVDSAGNAYITGYAWSTDFPIAGNPYQPRCGTDGTCNGGRDVFVTKFDASGSSMVYSTFLGGSGDDYGYAIALDSAKNVYVTGETDSRDFPGTIGHVQAANAGQNDVFVAKLNTDGSALVYATYLGGGNQDGGRGIAVDAAGNVYVTGYTGSSEGIPPFPTKNPIQATSQGRSAFVAEFNPAGTELLFSTYLGATDREGHGIAVDERGNIYVTGSTSGSDFPVTANAFQSAFGGGQFDGFVARIAQYDNPFTDISPSSVFYDYIVAIYPAYITSGCGANLYCPDAYVTREQMAAFIIRALEGERSNSYCSTGSLFQDVPPANVFCGDIKRVSELGITVVTGNYRPNDLVTRGQMAAFVVRAKAGENFSYTAAPYFGDVPQNNGFFKYVQKLKDLGITTLSGTYFVDRPVTRGEMAAFLGRGFLGMP